ncbi:MULTISPECIES: tol-pal system protein YbgF [Thioalkalivibrio]|uniref:tol-pal system protein YbgF n=1 Tax=Thioalkalivibrio TaxID=106633 RepID=UPI000373BAC8|nr:MULTISPECIES: tol-pal system protein YbgF [Thioalkalivibrio]
MAVAAGVLVLTSWGPLASTAVAQDEVYATQSQIRELSQRLDRIERMLDSSAMQELLRGAESMNREIRELRGEAETLRHEVERLGARQRDQFRNLDERVAAFETGEALPADTAAPTEEVIEFDLPEADEQAAYQEAFDQLMAGDYSAAMSSLERFIEDYPDSDYSANAWYWLAEAKYASGDFEAALEDFERLREDYPDSDKSGDALLKIGYAHYELGNEDEAREALEAVRADYGGTTLDRLARERLRRLDGQ